MTEVHHYTKADWLLCDRCQTPMPPEFWHRQRGKDAFIYDDECDSPFPISLSQTSDGITLIFEGGYGMFTDEMSQADRDRHTLNICHDCTVAILAMFPVDVQDRFVRGHPAYKDNTPVEERCCRYAWCFCDERERDTGVLTGE